MARRPPLQQLHAFDAAARHLSFTRAAAELAITQGAISQRIKALEQSLGVRLFDRLTRALALTPEGEILARSVREGFSRIDQGLEAVSADTGEGRILRLGVSASFASRWLAPRLADFNARHPDIEVHVTAEDRLSDLRAENIDLSVRFGLGDYMGLDVSPLMDDAVFPVCSPALATRLKRLEDLRGLVLLHDGVAERDGSGVHWRIWSEAMGVDLDCAPGPRFSQAFEVWLRHQVAFPTVA
ncbi:LysR family transcriptional regulator [Caulobacter sp. NIBR2454]|uniref:LysR family transcriptional regulator n=1 Tax=Caulobacter sp. NIBR2454 TaxID=3015996 RepID=UPI0022B628AF|nr:LysR family transcriptional regulator [Caulobacter sp. NIBR2454]